MFELNTAVAATIVAPVGSKVMDRRLNAVHQTTSLAARVLIAAHGGKVGKEAAMMNVPDAIEKLAKEASFSDYRGLAEVIAAATGKVTTIDRYRFHALPSEYADIMQTLESQGKAESPSTGKPTAAYALAAHLHRVTLKIRDRSEEMRAERKAEEDAKKEAQKLLADPTTAAILAEMDRIDAETAEQSA